MSDTEKLADLEGKPLGEPLILRPPVGNEVFRGLGAYRDEMVHRPGICWPRSIVLRMMLICILLATIAGCVLVIFALRHSNPWPWGHSRSREFKGFCRAITPFPGIDIDEQFFIERAGVMVSHAPIAGFPSVTIFHLIGNDDKSVMISGDNCYIYPITHDVAEAVAAADDSLVQRFDDSHYRLNMKSSITPQVFVMSPNDKEAVDIQDQFAAELCLSRQIFRLTEMVLAQPTVQANSSVAEHDCPKECPAGESRDFGVRQVCRCPPKEEPPNPALVLPPPPPGAPSNDFVSIPEIDGSGGESGPDDDDVMDDDDDEEDDFQDDPEGVFADEMAAEEGSPADRFDGLSQPNAWIPEDDEAIVGRIRRSVEEIHHLEPPIKVPSDCKMVEQILGVVIPGDRNQALPLMTLVTC